jgi:hypothetical protein
MLNPSSSNIAFLLDSLDHINRRVEDVMFFHRRESWLLA